MKKSMIFGIALIVAGIFSGLWLRPAEIDCGGSDIYAMEEREEAAQMIAEQVRSWEGCRLYSVIYAGDEVSEEQLEYCKKLDAETEECVVFDVRFRSPFVNSGAFEPHQVYDWTWYLGRSNGGPWKMLTWGAA